MTNDPMSCVPVLRPCPVLSAGSDDLPQASYRGQWRKWDTAGRGAGEQAKKTQASAASQVGQPLLGRPVPQPLRQVVGGVRCTGLHHWDWALAFKGKASCISEGGAVPEKQKTQRETARTPRQPGKRPQQPGF